jgi:hypothetical protein
VPGPRQIPHAIGLPLKRFLDRYLARAGTVSDGEGLFHQYLECGRLRGGRGGRATPGILVPPSRGRCGLLAVGLFLPLAFMKALHDRRAPWY